MKLGAEPKKIAILGAFLAVLVFVLYTNVFSGDSESPAPAAPPRVADPVPVRSVPEAAIPAPDTRRTVQNSNSNSSTEIKFRVGPERPEDRRDPATIDPTLRLDLLAKVQNVEPEAAMRNLFQYGAAPPPPAPPKPPIALPKNVPGIAINKPLPAPPRPPVASGPPPAPRAPPITFKYYGYKISKTDGSKEAFLLDGDDIIIAGENEEVKRGRYKVVNIGVNSITIEDTQFKSTQTLQIQPDAAA